jgi:hypothetical protein
MSTPLDDLTLRLSVDEVINRAQITVYPVETVGAEQVLWQAQTVLRLAPGQTRVVYAPFRDEHGARCGAFELIAPAPEVDYAINERADASGFDYTHSPSFSLIAEAEATRARLTLTSTAIGPLYVTALRVRGKPLLAYDPVTVEVSDTASQSAYERRALALDLPLQGDPGFAQSYAEYLVGRHAAPALAADALAVRDRDTLNGVNVFALELLDKLTITDPASGASGLGHWLRAVEYDLGAGGFHVTLRLERADDRQYWLLGKAGYGALDSTARLGF